MALDGIQTRATPRRFNLDRISYWLLMVATVAVVLLPAPLVIIPVDLVKRFSFGLIIDLSLLFWLFRTLQQNRLSVPRSPILASLGFLVSVTIISALLTPDRWPAFLGVALETSTVWFTLLLAVAVWLAAQLFVSKERIMFWYGLLIGSGLLAVAVQLIHVFAPRLTTFLPAVGAANLLGSWSDLGFFLGFLLVSLVLILELIDWSASPRARLALVGATLLAFLATSVIAPPELWWQLGIFALVIFSCQTIYGARTHRSWFRPVTVLLALAVLLIGLNFFPNTWPRLVGSGYDRLGINASDIRPSLELTGTIVADTLRTRPLVGVGPNNFLAAWLQHKPVDMTVGGTLDLDFESGYSWLSTQLVMIGLLGGAVWLIFFGFLLWSGWQFLLKPPSDSLSGALAALVFGGLSYLWVLAWWAVPGASLLILASLLTGIWVGLLVGLKRTPLKQVVFSHEQGWGLAGVIGVVFLIVLALIMLYGLGVRAYGWWRYSAIMSNYQQSHDATLALHDLLALRSIHRNEVFDRLSVDLINLQIKALAQKSASSTDQLRSDFLTLMNEGLSIAGQSLAEHGTNYANWLSRGSLYESIIPFGVENVSAAAIKDYEKVTILNPNSPLGYLALARTHLGLQSPKEAKADLLRALNAAPNAVQNILTLARLELSQGETTEAANLLAAAAARLPDQAQIWLALGYVRYQASQYREAIDDFKQTLTIDDSLAQAHYFLALSYAAAGERDLALQELALLQQASPENKELQDIIANVSAGRPALASRTVTPPAKKK